jgi:hypothetical protein
MKLRLTAAFDNSTPCPMSQIFLTFMNCGFLSSAGIHFPLVLWVDKSKMFEETFVRRKLHCRHSSLYVWHADESQHLVTSLQVRSWAAICNTVYLLNYSSASIEHLMWCHVTIGTDLVSFSTVVRSFICSNNNDTSIVMIHDVTKWRLPTLLVNITSF